MDQNMGNDVHTLLFRHRTERGFMELTGIEKATASLESYSVTMSIWPYL
jgi:hypothetical protein